MSSDTRNTDFQAVEAYIRSARLERAVVLGQMFAEGVDALARGLKRVTQAVLGAFANAANARTVEADAFMRRSISRN